MDTAYYQLQKPVTRLEVEEGSDHDRLSVWIDHNLAGTLVLPRSTKRFPPYQTTCLGTTVKLFADSTRSPLYSYQCFDSEDTVLVVTRQGNVLPGETQVISTDGDLLTIAQVKTLQEPRIMYEGKGA